MRNAERVSGMSVKELKKTISDAGQSHADCFEMSELRERAAEALLDKDKEGREEGGEGQICRRFGTAQGCPFGVRCRYRHEGFGAAPLQRIGKAEAELRAMFEGKKGMDESVAKEHKVAEEDKAITFNQVNCVTGPHFWCFECGEQPHDPLSCGLWRAFLDNAKSKMGVDLITGAQDGGVLNKLNEQWLKRNTKACPKCKTDILKADGCNHMTCGVKSCKHQWCWICLADWNGHGGSVYDCAKAGNGKAGKADDVNKQIAKNLAESKDAIGAGADYVGFLAQEDSRNLEAKWLTQERISKRMDDLQVRLYELYFMMHPSYACCCGFVPIYLSA